jgi:hypothetical protein
MRGYFHRSGILFIPDGGYRFSAGGEVLPRRSDWMSAVVAEPHQSGDLHVHGLVAGPGGCWRPDIALPWDIYAGLFKRFGRARVEACNNHEAVSLYCAKYLLKQQSRACDYYEVFGTKPAWHEGRDNSRL